MLFTRVYRRIAVNKSSHKVPISMRTTFKVKHTAFLEFTSPPTSLFIDRNISFNYVISNFFSEKYPRASAKIDRIQLKAAPSENRIHFSGGKWPICLGDARKVGQFPGHNETSFLADLWHYTVRESKRERKSLE